MAESFQEYAEDVTDLRQAQGIIAWLRRRITELEQDAEPIENEIWITVTNEDAERLRVLYEDGELAFELEADPGREFDEAFDYFVGGAIHMAWDLAYSYRDKKAITPSV